MRLCHGQAASSQVGNNDTSQAGTPGRFRAGALRSVQSVHMARSPNNRASTQPPTRRTHPAGSERGSRGSCLRDGCGWRRPVIPRYGFRSNSLTKGKETTIQLDALRVVAETKHRIAVHVQQTLQADNHAANGPDRHTHSLSKRGQRQTTSRFEQRIERHADDSVIECPRACELALRGICGARGARA